MKTLSSTAAHFLIGGLFLSAATTAGELDGSAWRLVNIASMDDTNYAPDDPARYTLVFGKDGRATLQADCNRGSAAWSSTGPGNVEFGPLAATRAMCPPESLSGKYLAQFEWVRSYVMKDGHLFLATMADGAIIEFEPLPPVVATVLDEEVRTSDATEMQSTIISVTVSQYQSLVDNPATVAKPEEGGAVTYGLPYDVSLGDGRKADVDLRNVSMPDGYDKNVLYLVGQQP